ncbi:tyrosine recombinase XerC [Massilia sp. Dwa41.01b]|uniref:tyrosine recombinase XerC n=1 Tax=unclassified Massilia TaxID=2609279 RepID=UPI0016001418|nr:MULTISPECIES: tyrosine recombinase XerC [unclassified Massilia]QNA90760.1 tyrosine recombinase XerC [Massilia sp. Dwa41.01b]QNB01284.1 tyrosine recombinase XerC [Massilia sp. Se16.2.3]
MDTARADWAGRYLSELATQRQLSAHTIAAYRRDLAELARLAGHEDWPTLTHADMRRFAARLHAEGHQPRSIARKLSGWRGFYGWLSRHVSLAANPVEGVRAPRRARTLPKALAVDAAVQLLEANRHGHPEPAELCDRAMFELLYSSGLRVSELAGLDLVYTHADGAVSLGWLDLEQGEVVVTGKGNKMRRVPVGGPAREALVAWLAVRPGAKDGSAALFLSNRGTRITPRVVQQRLKQHAIKAGASVHVHPHVLRHSFASHLLQSSGDLRAVQELLGHASITSTQVYTALDFQHLAAVYDRAHPRAKAK